MRAPAKEQPRRTTVDDVEARRRRCNNGQRRTAWRHSGDYAAVGNGGRSGGAFASGGGARRQQLWRDQRLVRMADQQRWCGSREDDQQRDDSDETLSYWLLLTGFDILVFEQVRPTAEQGQDDDTWRSTLRISERLSSAHFSRLTRPELTLRDWLGSPRGLRPGGAQFVGN
ncbi:hypothetical protein Scep_021856 [Stephania cephalantha]|uniref:Uncharacterized protein n=1 Tax=Stephania cephalantha TaxID=152367 RepID=A0AAP0I0J5_9MAGN